MSFFFFFKCFHLNIHNITFKVTGSLLLDEFFFFLLLINGSTSGRIISVTFSNLSALFSPLSAAPFLRHLGGCFYRLSNCWVGNIRNTTAYPALN